MKRILSRTALAAAGVVISVLMVFVIVNHGHRLISAGQGPPGEGIAMPEPPLPGDDAFLTMSGLAGRIDKKLVGRDCVGNKPPFRLDPDCFAFLKTQAGALKALDKWVAASSPYKLERPAHLGRHSRFPLPGTLSDSTRFLESHDFRRFKALATLLALRSLVGLSAGDVASAERDLRIIFLLGAFLQQNPPLIAEMIGIQVHGIGLMVIVQHVRPAAVREGLETMLPASESIRDGMRMAIGAEWIIGQDSIKQLGPAPSLYEQAGPLEIVLGRSLPWFTYMPPSVIRALGLYDRDHSLRLAAAASRTAQNDLVRGTIASSFRDLAPGACDWKAMGPIKWIHNPVGRWWTCMFQPMWPEMNARVGQAIDQVEATRVVLAARRFWLRHRRWPTRESDLVPAYLSEWPKSALDGQPLSWMGNKAGVQIHARDGKSPCQAGDFCAFPFEPPWPVGKH